MNHLIQIKLRNRIPSLLAPYYRLSQSKIMSGNGKEGINKDPNGQEDPNKCAENKETNESDNVKQVGNDPVPATSATDQRKSDEKDHSDQQNMDTTLPPHQSGLDTRDPDTGSQDTTVVENTNSPSDHAPTPPSSDAGSQPSDTSSKLQDNREDNKKESNVLPQIKKAKTKEETGLLSHFKPSLTKSQTEMHTRQRRSEDRLVEIKDCAAKFIAMATEEKRKLYKCGRQFFTIEGIPSVDNLALKGKIAIVHKKSTFKSNPDFNKKLSIWRGDITKLEIDAIVNAANSSLLGGGGVDGAIHSAAGYKLREECSTLGGCRAGDAKITAGYNLPAKYVIHTVGPMDGREEKLKSCYERCFDLVAKHNIRTVAFPCIATGIYGYPNDAAAEVALACTRDWLESNREKIDRIIFCVFLDIDKRIYHDMVPYFFPLEDQGEPPVAMETNQNIPKGHGREEGDGEGRKGGGDGDGEGRKGGGDGDGGGEGEDGDSYISCCTI